jgi:plastocyanin
VHAHGKKATGTTKAARKLARKFAGKQMALLLHSKTLIRRGGKTVIVQELAAGDGLTVGGRLCKVNGRRPLRWTASVVSARPGAGGGEGQGGLQLTATAVKFDKTHLEAKSGSVTITLRNNSPLEHNVAIRGNGVDVKGRLVGKGGTSTATATLAPGEYVFYCSVPGHEQAGMKGTLTVK